MALKEEKVKFSHTVALRNCVVLQRNVGRHTTC